MKKERETDTLSSLVYSSLILERLDAGVEGPTPDRFYVEWTLPGKKRSGFIETIKCRVLSVIQLCHYFPIDLRPFFNFLFLLLIGG